MRFAEDTRYHRLAVVDDEDTRYLRFDNSLQSAMYLREPFRTRYRYTDFFHLGIAYNPDARNVLFVGLGAGSSEKRLWRDFPKLQIEAVELDPVVVDVAHRYFGLPRDPRLRVEVGDGRRYLARDERRWDVIVIDAFFADAIPAHLVTQEFLELVRERLAPGGVVVTNAIGALAGPGSRLFRSVYKTYRTAFPTVLVHPTILAGDQGDEQYRNLILVGTEKAVPGRQQLADRWAAIREQTPSVPDLERPILDRRDGEIPTADVPVLTDDYAPTDAFFSLTPQLRSRNRRDAATDPVGPPPTSSGKYGGPTRRPSLARPPALPCAISRAGASPWVGTKPSVRAAAWSRQPATTTEPSRSSAGRHDSQST